MLKEHKQERKRQLLQLRVANIIVALLYVVAILVGILKVAIAIIAFLLLQLLTSVLQIWCLCRISNQLKEMKHILPNKQVFIVHTANTVINTLNWTVISFALIQLSYRMPGYTFNWVNITDSKSAEYISIFLAFFSLAFILCFFNVAMFM